MATYYLQTSADNGATWGDRVDNAGCLQSYAIKAASRAAKQTGNATRVLLRCDWHSARDDSYVRIMGLGYRVVAVRGVKRVTVAAVKAHCKALGLSARKTGNGDEWRVAWPGDEASAAYCDGPGDAMGTATAMAEHKRNHPTSPLDAGAPEFVNGYPVVAYRAGRCGQSVVMVRSKPSGLAVWHRDVIGNCYGGDYCASAPEADAAFARKVRLAGGEG